MKTCSKCMQTKSFEDFHKHGHAKCGYRPWCRRCHNDAGYLNRKTKLAKYRALNSEQKRAERKLYPDRQKNIDLKKNYGISLEQYNEMFSAQGGCCAIYDKHQALLKKSLHVDHDHGSGEIRGLLCNGCNFGIGQFKDDPDILNRAVSYLRRSKIKLVGEA